MFIRSDNKELSNGGSLDGKVISLALEKCFVFSRRHSLSPEDSERLWEVQSVISLCYFGRFSHTQKQYTCDASSFGCSERSVAQEHVYLVKINKTNKLQLSSQPECVEAKRRLRSGKGGRNEVVVFPCDNSTAWREEGGGERERERDWKSENKNKCGWGTFLYYW